MVLVLYRLIFKPLKIILTGKKLVPDSSFAATTMLVGKDRPCPVQIATLGCLWASEPSERPEPPPGTMPGSLPWFRKARHAQGREHEAQLTPCQEGPRGHFPSFARPDKEAEAAQSECRGEEACAAVRATAAPGGPPCPSSSLLFYKIITRSLYVYIMCVYIFLRLYF